MPAANTISSNGKFWDWMEFNNEVFSGFHKWIADMVHEVDRTIPVHAKLYDVTFNRSKLDKGIDAEELYSYLDYNGTDGGMNYESTREGFLHIRMAEDLANSIKDKPMVNSENHIIPDNCEDYSDKHALVAGADLWQGFLHGRTASAAWVWRRHDTYPEYKHSISYRPDVVANISEKTMNANRFADELEKLQNSERNFFILYSNAALLYNEAEYMSACSNAYEALWSIGQRASFVTEKQIEAGKLSAEDILIIPAVSNIDDRALFNLNTFKGKTIVIGDAPMKNEYDRVIDLNLTNSISVPDEISAIINVYENILNEKNIPVITFKTQDGNYLGMTDIRTVRDGNSILVNACNNTWNTIENVSLYIGDVRQSGGYDILKDEEINSVVLEPFEPVLLRFDISEPDYSLKNVKAYSRNNGVIIRWDGGDGAVFVKSKDRLLGSVLADNGYINISGLENGTEYTLEVSSSKSDISVSINVTPGDNDVSVLKEGMGENGYSWRIVNNTGSEIKYIFETVNSKVNIILPPWGEKFIQTGESN